MWALWARKADSAQVQISATSGEASLIDQYGHETAIQPTNGMYTLTLAGARCDKADGCAVGGNVILLVQPTGTVTIQELTSTGTVDLKFE